MSRQQSLVKSMEQAKDKEEKTGTKLIEEEKAETGNVTMLFKEFYLYTSSVHPSVFINDCENMVMTKIQIRG